MIKTTHLCQHSSARTLKSKKWLVKRKLESSEVSTLLIRTLILKSKTQKMQKFFQDLTFQKTCFTWESWKFQSFQVFSAGSHTKIKTDVFKTCKFQICFIWRSWNFPRFLSFLLWPLYWNVTLRKLEFFFKTRIFQRICFIWESWKIWRFTGFQFRPFTEIKNF